MVYSPHKNFVSSQPVGEVTARVLRIPLLQKCEKEAVSMLVNSAEKMELQQGEVLFEKEEMSKGGYFVLSGHIGMDQDLTTDDYTNIIGPDCLIGEYAMIAPIQHPFQADILEDATLLFMSRDMFHRILREFPLSASRIMLEVKTRFQQYEEGLRKLEKQLHR
jgi:CRP-like cAMP-binding protein